MRPMPKMQELAAKLVVDDFRNVDLETGIFLEMENRHRR
jgi:hypothetical protein